MPIDVDLQPLFDASVTICKRSSIHTSGYTKPGYQTTSNGTTYSAHIERSEDMVRTELGHEVVSRRKIFLYATTSWSNSDNIPAPTDKIILPATHPPTEPQIISVAPVSDEAGIHHILVLTG